GSTQVLGTRMSNDVRANYSNHRLASLYALDDFGGALRPPSSVLFPAAYSSANDNFILIVRGAGEYVQGKSVTNEQRQVNVVDNLSVAAGNHQLKLGVDYRWLAPFTSPFSYRQFAQFTGVTAAPGGALSGAAAFAQSTAYEGSALLAHNLSIYGQDTWKVTPRLTVTY